MPSDRHQLKQLNGSAVAGWMVSHLVSVTGWIGPELFDVFCYTTSGQSRLEMHVSLHNHPPLLSQSIEPNQYTVVDLNSFGPKYTIFLSIFTFVNLPRTPIFTFAGERRKTKLQNYGICFHISIFRKSFASDEVSK